MTTTWPSRSSACNTVSSSPSWRVTVAKRLPLRLVVAVGASDPVVGVAQVVLGDLGGSVVWGEDQVLVEDHGPEGPARRGRQAAAEVFEALVGLAGVDDEAGRLHAPRVAVGVVQEEGRRALADAELGVALAGDRLVGDALVLAHLLGHVQPHHPPRRQPAEVALGAHHGLNPVQAPQPRAVLERAEDAVLLRQVLDVDLVQHVLRAGIPGSGGVVHPDRVVDPGDQVVGDRVAADQEDLCVPLAADALEADQLGAFVVLGQLGRQPHDPVLLSYRLTSVRHRRNRAGRQTRARSAARSASAARNWPTSLSSASRSSEAPTDPSTSLVSRSRSSTRTALLSIRALSSDAIAPENFACPAGNAIAT